MKSLKSLIEQHLHEEGEIAGMGPVIFPAPDSNEIGSGDVPKNPFRKKKIATDKPYDINDIEEEFDGIEVIRESVSRKDAIDKVFWIKKHADAQGDKEAKSIINDMKDKFNYKSKYDGKTGCWVTRWSNGEDVSTETLNKMLGYLKSKGLSKYAKKTL